MNLRRIGAVQVGRADLSTHQYQPLLKTHVKQYLLMRLISHIIQSSLAPRGHYFFLFDFKELQVLV